MNKISSHRKFIHNVYALAAMLFLTPSAVWGQYFFDSQISSGEDLYTTGTFSLVGPVKSVHREDVVFREHCSMALPYIIFNIEGIQCQYRDLTFNKEGLLESREGVPYIYITNGTQAYKLLKKGYSDSRTYNSKGELSSRRAIIFDTNDESTLYTQLSIIDSTKSKNDVLIRYTRRVAEMDELEESGDIDNCFLAEDEPADTNVFRISRNFAGAVEKIVAYDKNLYCLEYNTGYRHNSHFYASWSNSSYNTIITFKWDESGNLLGKNYYRSGKEGERLLFSVEMQYEKGCSRAVKMFMKGGWGTTDGRAWAWVDPENEGNWPKFEFTCSYDNFGNMESVDVTYTPDTRVEASYFSGARAFDNGGNFWDLKHLGAVEKHMITYKYEYDSYGNWTSQKLFANGELLRTIKRCICYWK